MMEAEVVQPAIRCALFAMAQRTQTARPVVLLITITLRKLLVIATVQLTHTKGPLIWSVHPAHLIAPVVLTVHTVPLVIQATTF